MCASPIFCAWPCSLLRRLAFQCYSFGVSGVRVTSSKRPKIWYLLILAIFLTVFSIYTWKTTQSGLASGVELQFLQYAIVIDAGSSGSRVYLYGWPPHSGREGELLRIQPIKSQLNEPLVSKASPGLSSFSDNPGDAFSYISPLLQFAATNIPPEKHSETSLFILGTAGMRLLDKASQEMILGNLRVEIPRHYAFHFPADHIEVLSGRQEGLFQWMAINFVLGKFQDSDGANNGSKSDSHPPTVGALDMGGASLQIAFEVNDENLPSSDSSKVSEVSLGCNEHDSLHRYRVYISTFLGYGANEALQKYQLQTLKENWIENNQTNSLPGTDPTHPIRDPCLPRDMKDVVHVEFGQLPTASPTYSHSKKAHFKGTGNWDGCYEKLVVLAKDLQSPSWPYQHHQFYGFSEFWYTLEDVLRIGGKYQHDKLRQESQVFCSTKWTNTMQRFSRGAYPFADEHRIHTQCFKSAWLAVILHEALGFPKSSHNSSLISSPNSIGGSVVHWTLGALLYRTRYLPLRAVEQANSQLVHYGIYHPPWASGYLYAHYIVFICFLAVVAAIVMYLFRLHKQFQKGSSSVHLEEGGGGYKLVDSRNSAVMMKLNPYVFR